MVQADIRWGILGPGFIAGLFAEDLARTPGATATAVASRDLGRAQPLPVNHGIARAYGDYAALAADPHVDIVYIATPHSHHFAHAKDDAAGGQIGDAGKALHPERRSGGGVGRSGPPRGLFLMDAMWTLCNPCCAR